jgi:hypothetical protein
MVQDPLALRILEGDFPEGSKIRVDVRDKAGAGDDLLEFVKV